MSILYEGSSSHYGGEVHPDETLPNLISPKVLASTTTLLVLSLGVYSARIYVRCRPYINLGLDDLTISIAMALTIAGYAILLRLHTLLDGLHPSQLGMDEIILILKLSFVLSPLWVWSVAMVKLSVLFMLLRIKQTPRWRMGVVGLIVTITLSTVAIMVTQLIQCNPISANWKPQLQQTSCWSAQKILNVNYSVSSLFILTDFICALLPLAFIWKINRPFRERVVLAILMGLGLIAGTCGIIKLALLGRVRGPRDGFDTADLSIWAFAEMFVGIIAACIPCLKSLLERAFRALGGNVSSSATSGPSESGPRSRIRVLDGSTSYNLQTMRSSKQVHVGRQITILHSQISDDDVPFAHATATADARSTSKSAQSG